MELIPILSRVGSHAMDNLRETIHENEALNKQADHVRTIVTNFVINFFNSQEHRRSI